MYEVDRYVETNARGTALLLDELAHARAGVHRLVVASSRAVYGEGAYSTEDGRTVHPPPRNALDMSIGDFDVHLPGEGRLAPVATAETAPPQPSSVYGITKHLQESLVLTVAPTLGIVPVVMRFQNVYGPGQSLTNPYTGILSIFSGLIRRGCEVNIFEDGEESRDFVFVDDAVEAAFLCAVHPQASGVYNVGSGTATTVMDVARILSEAFRREADVRISGQFRVGDIRHNVAALDRIRALGWSPRVPFLEGVSAFAEWVLRQPSADGGYESSLGELTSRGLLR
jgi:dTDP-L-rhamnose 4-epimerase